MLLYSEGSVRSEVAKENPDSQDSARNIEEVSFPQGEA